MDQEHKSSWLKKRRERRENVRSEELLEALLAGKREALSRAITLLESTLVHDRKLAAELIGMCLPYSGRSLRIGITGVPGVGKSTFIEAFGMFLVGQGKKVAVLAIDPSSAQGGGSILGDKTRMQHLSAAENVFIRPSPAGKTLGGVAAKTRESMLLCEAAGYDVILVETVGVGQSETQVHAMVDFFLLLMLSGAGDELQGIKRGIMEMADALVITKADGSNEKMAALAAREYANALHLFPPKSSQWIAPSFTCSAVQNKNIDEVWKVVESFQNQTLHNGWFEQHRKLQDQHWLRETLKELILADFFDNENWMDELKKFEIEVLKGQRSSYQAAVELYTKFKK
jgi:LAO/AO transport system kinase